MTPNTQEKQTPNASNQELQPEAPFKGAPFPLPEMPASVNAPIEVSQLCLAHEAKKLEYDFSLGKTLCN